MSATTTTRRTRRTHAACNQHVKNVLSARRGIPSALSNGLPGVFEFVQVVGEHGLLPVVLHKRVSLSDPVELLKAPRKQLRRERRATRNNQKAYAPSNNESGLRLYRVVSDQCNVTASPGSVSTWLMVHKNRRRIRAWVHGGWGLRAPSRRQQLLGWTEASGSGYSCIPGVGGGGATENT